MEIILAALIFGVCFAVGAYFLYRTLQLKAKSDRGQLADPTHMPTPMRPPAPDAVEGELLDASDMLDEFEDATRVASVSESLRAQSKK